LDLSSVVKEGRLAILSLDINEDPVGFENAPKLFLIPDTPNLLRYRGSGNLQHIQEGFPEDLSDWKVFLFEQTVLGAEDLQHFLEESLGFAGIPPDALEGASLPIREGTIPVLFVEKVGDRG
jgi:hypothetical protein